MKNEQQNLKPCTARHCVTEEIIDCLTDGEYCFDENGNPLDVNFIPLPTASELFHILAGVSFAIALIGLICFMWSV